MKVASVAGVAAAVVMTAGWVVGGLLQPASYSWLAQEISDLGALTARHAWVWNISDSVSGALLVVFAAGLYMLLGSSRAGRIGVALIVIAGVGGVFDGFLREDCPLSTSQACQRMRDNQGLSWHHQAHNVESIVVFGAMLAAPFLVARALGYGSRVRGLRKHAFRTGLALVVATLAYLGLYGHDGAGVAERAVVLLYVVWIAALALAMRNPSRFAPTRERAE